MSVRGWEYKTNPHGNTIRLVMIVNSLNSAPVSLIISDGSAANKANCICTDYLDYVFLHPTGFQM